MSFGRRAVLSICLGTDGRALSSLKSRRPFPLLVGTAEWQNQRFRVYSFFRMEHRQDHDRALDRRTV